MDHRTRTVVLRVALSVAALVVVAYFGFRERHLFVGFGKDLAHADWWWVVLALAAQLISIVPLAETQRLVLRAGGVDSPFGEMVAVTLASNAIATSVPAGVAVAEGYAFARYKHFGADLTRNVRMCLHAVRFRIKLNVGFRWRGLEGWTYGRRYCRVRS